MNREVNRGEVNKGARSENARDLIFVQDNGGRSPLDSKLKDA